MRYDKRIVVIIPALNEEAAIGQVVANVPQWVDRVLVVDNGSTDKTASHARAAAADVVFEPQRGYGAACLAGLAAVAEADIVVFLDGDFSDDPQEMSRLVDPIARGKMDFVLGSRTLGEREAGALTLQARVGNVIACALIRLLFGQSYSDLGPFRAISRSALRSLNMTDRDYGWTVEMQVKAAMQRLRIDEVPVSYRRRIGKSKISGTLRGVVGASIKIPTTIVRHGVGPIVGR